MRARTCWCFGLVLLLAACAREPVDVNEEAVVVPGDWNPPGATRALAATQHVDVVDPPSVLPLGSCTSTNPWEGTCTHPACTRAHPGTSELDVYIRGRWSYVGAGGVYTCRRNSNPASTAYLSVHSVGRAIDLMIPTIGGDADNTRGDAVANWLVENAEYIGIQRVIWDGIYWNGERGFSEMSDARTSSGAYRTDHHVNHIHVEMSVDGAARRTRFFTDGAPAPTCPIVCYGTAVVAADCSYVDCALTGEVCLDGPPRCGPGAPPEPLEAALNTSAPLASVAPLGALSRFEILPATRVFDTRDGADSTRLSRTDGATTGPLTATRRGTVTDWPALPSGASALWLNLAAIPRAAPGFVSAVPFGTTPSTSVLNYAPGRVRANAAAIALGAANGVTFSSSQDVDLVADVSGAFVPSGLGLRTVGPLRILDTRSTGTPIASGTSLALDIGAPSDVRAMVASVTVVGGAASGFVTAYPCGAALPGTSNVNFVAGEPANTTVISELGDGDVCFFANVDADLIVDLIGWLVPDGELSYQPLVPARVLDTREVGARYEGRLGARQTIELPIATLPGMPADARAVMANITATAASGPGYVTAFPCGSPVPGTSSGNFLGDSSSGSLSLTALGSGSLCIFASARTHLVVDLAGVWVPTPAAPPPMPGPGPIDPDRPEPMEPPTGPPDPEELLDGDVLDVDAGAEEYDDAAILLPDGRVIPGMGRDAGAARAIAAGCSCRAGGGSGASGAHVASLVLALTLAVRRKKRTTHESRRRSLRRW